jgi:hypothetical protein
VTIAVCLAGWGRVSGLYINLAAASSPLQPVVTTSSSRTLSRAHHTLCPAILVASDPPAFPPAGTSARSRTRSAQIVVQATRRPLHQSLRQANVDCTANFPASLSVQPQLERATSPNDVQPPRRKYSAPPTPFLTLITRSQPRSRPHD